MKDKRALVEKILSTNAKNTSAYKSAYKMLVNSPWEGLIALHLILAKESKQDATMEGNDMNEKEKMVADFIGNDTLETLLSMAKKLNLHEDRLMKIYEAKGLFGLKKNIVRRFKEREFSERLKRLAADEQLRREKE